MWRLRNKYRHIIEQMVPKFGFNGFGEVTYYRTYSRLKEDGTQETWNDTVIRVIEGMMDIRDTHCKQHNLPWDEEIMQDVALDMASTLFEMKWLPPGRGLWAMGTSFVKERGSAALNNCGAVDTLDLVKSATWAMDMLMCGVGVGYNLAWLGKVQTTAPNTLTFNIPDTREGWIDSVRLLLSSYTLGTSTPHFNYDLIRLEGEPIRGFGGTASGPAPLVQLHERIRTYMQRRLDGTHSAGRTTSDVFNAIGACVVAGNVRRSALINLGSPFDEEFLDLKDYTKNPDRMEIGWMSNNTAVFEEGGHFSQLPRIAERILNNGEPGICNLVNVNKYGRYGEKSKDKAWLANPCQSYDSLVLSPQGLVKFGDLAIGDTIWSAEGWTTVIYKQMTGMKQVHRYHTTAGYFEGTEKHRIVSGGSKVEVGKAYSIDILKGPIKTNTQHNMDLVMDGLVIGDGTVHTASSNLVYICKSNIDDA